ncbi:MULTISPECIES: DUF6928 family protein [Streptomyces]|uniref:Uncharacterized protein n=2 Tax=Streptomyces rimosus subsp. rimosus TaxID=132474 RepID=A0A8A1V3P6_STRR1|nr:MULTISPECIES: hypothetical protein [Streptomyces]MYT47915.1 hypothetical protein [Streptomyces sp. SID5471]KEF03606.1 hypothetical protein DF17_27535 [Streptomyces rimosus]KEF16899.1 hypothetical protein DF18_32395 [Streptomyces rimosus]KOT34478.1 hypothetical protein ADK42_22190 [Streptomyces rimosus subsp. rimosus]KOT57335.1 hypothetical protein ADK44_21625 [Streptomyces rimosus subsp. rimosus]
MGSKAAIVAFADEHPRNILRREPEIDLQKARLLAEEVLGATASETELLPLDLAAWPSPGTVCTASFPGLEIVCSRDLAKANPSQLTEYVARRAAGRTAYGVFMHSAEDWASFAMWSGGELLRSVSMSPDSGITEDLGERLSFEIPFWNGQRPASDSGYSLPFHPVELGNEALREFFGFILEGHEDSSCIDPEEIEMPAFCAGG